jgi:ferredoxin
VTIQIDIDADKCMGSSNCTFWAPETFDVSDEGLAFVLDPEGDPTQKVRSAADACPTGAISVRAVDDTA